MTQIVYDHFLRKCAAYAHSMDVSFPPRLQVNFIVYLKGPSPREKI